MTKTILTMCVLLLASSCFAQTEPPKEGIPAVVEGSNNFAIDLYAKLAKDKGNVFFSPSSINTALAMAYAGTAGDTAKQMAKTLHFSLPAEKLHPAFADLLKILNTPPLVGKGKDRKPAYQLSVTNALWGQKNFPFKPDFTQLLNKSYEAGLRELDFAQSDAARKTINDWVAKQTKDKIKDLIPEGVLNGDTRLVLTNAIYFKSKWATEFVKASTGNGHFKLLTGKEVDVPLMYQKSELPYMENDDLQLLELPYVHNEASMVILLPKKADGLANVEKQLSVANLNKWLKAKKATPVMASVPKFTFTIETMLADTLKNMGMTDAFDPAKADMSGVTGDKRLFISHVIHKAFVAVDEEGTEAAAATAEPETLGIDENTKTFYADHPFVFFIRHNSTGEILFMGRLVNPQGVWREGPSKMKL